MPPIPDIFVLHDDLMYIHSQSPGLLGLLVLLQSVLCDFPKTPNPIV